MCLQAASYDPGIASGNTQTQPGATDDGVEQSLAAQRALVVARVKERRAELIEGALAEMHERCSELFPAEDPEPIEVLRGMTAGSFDHYVASMEIRSDWHDYTPSQTVDGARYFAGRRASLDALLRAYRVAHACIWDMIMEEIVRFDLPGAFLLPVLKAASRSEFAYCDHMMAVVSREYTAEVGDLTRSQEQRRVELVRRVLDGGSADSGELGYDLDCEHIAVVASGPHGQAAIQSLAEVLRARALVISRSEQSTWAWLGTSGPLDGEVLGRLAAWAPSDDVAVGIGDPGSGADGFRASHDQALAAHGIGALIGRRVVRYGDVALLAAVANDPHATASLIATYLGPLQAAGDQAPILKDTLEAYLSTNGNATSAAALLGVHERTVGYRLRKAEELIGRPIGSCRAELQVALQLAAIKQGRVSA
jgi:hypothetical protein